MCLRLLFSALLDEFIGRNELVCEFEINHPKCLKSVDSNTVALEEANSCGNVPIFVDISSRFVFLPFETVDDLL